MQGTVVMAVQESDLEWSEVDRPVSVILGKQSHRLSAQGFTQLDSASVPLDLSIVPDPPHRHPRLVLRGVHPLGIRAFRLLVLPSRRLLSQDFMRPLLVVLLAPAFDDQSSLSNR